MAARSRPFIPRVRACLGVRGSRREASCFALTSGFDTKRKGFPMHQIVLLTAMTATTGLFGGGRQCTSGRCNVSYRPAPVVAQAYVPRSPAYTVQPPAPVAVAPRTAFYQRYYSAPTAATCTSGTCPKR